MKKPYPENGITFQAPRYNEEKEYMFEEKEWKPRKLYVSKTKMKNLER